MAAVFRALYTPHLTQKRKKWYDGQCRFVIASNKVRLSDEEGRLLAEQFWASRAGTGEIPEPGATITFDRYIVELDELVRMPSVEEQRAESHVSRTQGTRALEAHTRGSGSIAPRPVALKGSRIPREGPETGREPHEAPREARESLSLGPPLEDVLKSDAVRVLRPLNVFEPEKRRKYAPWGDPHAPSGVSFGESPSFVPPRPSSSSESPESTGDILHNRRDPQESSSLDMHHTSWAVKEEIQDTRDLNVPDVYDSDLESEPEILDVAHKPRTSMFADVPDELPAEGPWTKEAYILFSWHPPVVKEEVP